MQRTAECNLRRRHYRDPQGILFKLYRTSQYQYTGQCDKYRKNAFNSCVNLKDVHLSAKLESIEAGAFNNCESLSKIQLPSTLKVLRGSAFSGTSLTEINIPPQMKTEDYTAANRAWGGPFAGLTTLKKVTFDQGMEEILRGIFLFTGSMLMLEEVVLPDSVKNRLSGIL